MILALIPQEELHQLARPSEPDVLFWTFKSISTVKSLFGKGNQNIINCGSSMLEDTPTLKPQIESFIKEHFDLNHYLLGHAEKRMEQFLYLLATNLIEFKTNRDLRRAIWHQIYNVTTYEFSKNIYPGFLFVVIAIYFMLQYTMFNRFNRPESTQIINHYFATKDELKIRLIQAISDVDIIYNINSLCHGRYFFVDYRLADYKDHKPFPRKLAQILVKARIKKAVS